MKIDWSAEEYKESQKHKNSVNSDVTGDPLPLHAIVPKHIWFRTVLGFSEWLNLFPLFGLKALSVVAQYKILLYLWQLGDINNGSVQYYLSDKGFYLLIFLAVIPLLGSRFYSLVDKFSKHFINR